MLEMLSSYVICLVCLFVCSFVSGRADTWTTKNGRRQNLGFGVDVCISTYINTPRPAQMRSLNVNISNFNARETFAAQRYATHAPSHRDVAVRLETCDVLPSTSPALDYVSTKDGHWRDFDVFARSGNSIS